MKYSASIVLAFYTQSGLGGLTFEHQFHPTRRWRFDLAWPSYLVAVEVQGGLFCGGRHNQGAAMLREYEKLNHAAALGWRVLFCQPKDVCTMDMVRLVRQAIGQS